MNEKNKAMNVQCGHFTDLEIVNYERVVSIAAWPK